LINEPWPSAANSSLINYPDYPKPGFYAVKDACRPVLASGVFEKFEWVSGELFSVGIWILNDLYEEYESLEVSVLLQADETISLGTWFTGSVLPNQNIEGPVFKIRLPEWQSDRFQVLLQVKDNPELNSQYVICYRSGKNQKEKKARFNF